MKRYFLMAPILPVLAFALVSCEATGHVEIGVASSAGPMDDMRGSVDHVYAVVTRVDVRETSESSAGTTEATWYTVFEGNAQVDLADMASAPSMLGGKDVPAGDIDRVRIVLASDTEVVFGTLSVTVTCTSCSSDGFEAALPEPSTLDAHGSLNLTLDFTETLDATHTSFDPTILAYVEGSGSAG
jgi:hypothetical protein